MGLFGSDRFDNSELGAHVPAGFALGPATRRGAEQRPLSRQLHQAQRLTLAARPATGTKPWGLDKPSVGGEKFLPC